MKFEDDKGQEEFLVFGASEVIAALVANIELNAAVLT